MYKPPVKTNETLNGLAKVRLAKKGEERYLLVSLTQGTGDDAVTTEMYIKPSSVPPYMFVEENGKKRLSASEWRVRISADKSKILSAIPSDAIVEAVFKDIAHREGEDPTPYKKTTKFGDVLQFVWLWEVTGGEFAGAEIPQYLNYNFDVAEDDQGRDVVAYSHPKSKYTAELDGVLSAAGVWEYGALPWSENVLPKLRKRAIRAREEKGAKVKLTINNGYILSVKPLTVGGWDEEDTDYNPKQPEKPQAVAPDDEEESVPTNSVKDDDDIPWDD